jgi:hypothetical protein
MRARRTDGIERVMARAMVAEDPVAAIARAAKRRGISEEDRAALVAAAGFPDGVRIAALLVTKLRFERLIRGSRAAEEWFTSDAEGFARAFREYQGEVAPTAFFPGEEARLFERWRKKRKVKG